MLSKKLEMHRELILSLRPPSRGSLTNGSKSFHSVFVFGGDNVDPLHVTSHFVHTILDFHVFGRDSLQKATMRAFKPEVSAHTSVFLAQNGTVLRFTNAAWRRRPNGVDIRCCNQIPKYVTTKNVDGRDIIIFRCKEINHVGNKRFRIFPLQERQGERQFLGERNSSHRVLIEYL